MESNIRSHLQRSAPSPLPPRQIKNESFLEDINNVLNSGDIPNLYAPDEQDQIITTMRPYVQEQGLQPTKANLMAAYTGRVRSNIHMVLCMRYRDPSQPHRDSRAGWVALRPDMRRNGLGLTTVPWGPDYCVLHPSCHAIGLCQGPGFLGMSVS